MRTPRVSMCKQCGYKYLLHLMGTWPAHSNKLKQLLACGLVVMPQADFYEFWYPLLRPFEHFVPSANLALFNGNDLPGVHSCLQQHDDAAQRIANASRAFIRDVLTPELLDEYMRALLERVSVLMVAGGAMMMR